MNIVKAKILAFFSDEKAKILAFWIWKEVRKDEKDVYFQRVWTLGMEVAIIENKNAILDDTDLEV